MAAQAVMRLHHVMVTIPKGAEDEARAFYCGVLGLREIPKPASLVGRGGFWLEGGAVQIHVGTEDGIDRLATKAHFAYEVDDVQAWKDRLAALGIAPTDSVPIPGFERFEFRDPFGNRVELIQAL
jgi:catechol 2,3-dioxygenase-like lactoylglutathione lyase family enzyme